MVATSASSPASASVSDCFCTAAALLFDLDPIGDGVALGLQVGDDGGVDRLALGAMPL